MFNKNTFKMTKKSLLLLVVAIFCQLIFINAFAVKAYPFPIKITQPDGSQLTIKLRGDEFHHFQTTEDGYVLKENSKGFLTYATVNSSGQLTESNIVAQNIDKRTSTEAQFLKSIDKSTILQTIQNTRQKSKLLIQSNQPRKAYPLVGAPKALVILANFKDKAFSVASPQTSFQNLVTQDGYSANGGTGSARDYFMASSYGKFAPNFIVVGPVTLPQTLDYYGKNDASGNDTNPAQMIVDACAAADAAGLDFTQFDTDNDGYVDNVFVYYAGYNEAENGPANTIWPHRWSISGAGITTGITFDGKKIEDYSCTSELKGSSGTNMCGVGTFCHEFGHVLGLPDYYDTSGSSTYIPTLETWSVMDYGPYLNGGCTPPTYSAYDRFFLGYLTPEQISTGSNVTLQPLYQGKTTVANTNNQAYLLSATPHNLSGTAPSPAQFFLVEYRKHTGWDTYLGQNVDASGNLTTIPSDGMCIWHIDYLQSVWDSNGPNNYTGSTQTASSHMHVYLQPLSGQTTTPGTTFTTGSFTPTTWSGTNINRAITNIAMTTDNITFKLMGGAVGPTITSGTVTAFSTTLGTAATIQSVAISGTALTNNVQISLTTGSNFQIKLASGSTWGSSLTLTPVSGSVSETLQIRYNPSGTGNQTDQIAITSTGATAVNLNLSGTCTIGPNSPQIFAGKVDNSLVFSATKLNATSTKTINVKSTDLNNSLNFAITGADASMFTVSVSSVTKDSANATNGTNITVSFTPTSTDSHSATLTISGGGLSPDKVITLSGIGI
jgi:M6 family metalloprotease-like protein